MNIISWNVNGIRACAKKGFIKWLVESYGDIIGLQEVRADISQIPKDLQCIPNYSSYFSSAERKGYSGVGLYSKIAPDEYIEKLGQNVFDSEGRIQIFRFKSLWIINCYFPNGSGQNKDNSRIPYKLDFCDYVFKYLEPLLHQNEKIIVMGDFNTAHQELDIARPKQNEHASGFTKIERDYFSQLLYSGWIDTFRYLNQDKISYTWWSNRLNARERNVGWRIDYIIASKSVMPYITEAFILNQVFGSDHCPIGVKISDDFF